jgi:hypothetical protein
MLRSPLDAIAHGIGMVHQAFKLFESLSVWENIVYRREPRRGLFIDGARARQVEELARRHGLPIDPDAGSANLSVGVRQRARDPEGALSRGAVLILDEPTAVLTPAERDPVRGDAEPRGRGLHPSARDPQAERSDGGQRSRHRAARRPRRRADDHRRDQSAMPSCAP